MEPTLPPTQNTITNVSVKKSSNPIIFIVIGITVVGIIALAIYGVKTYLANKQPVSSELTITIFPTICTKDYAPLPDIPYRNSFDNLYYGEVMGKITKIEKDSKQSRINMYIKTPHAVYIFPISLLNPHNNMYDLKSHQSYPITNITAGRDASLAFSCNFDKPDTVSVTVTVK